MTYTPPTGAGNVTTGSATSGTTLTVSKPANLADGDLLLLYCYKQPAGTTFTTPSGFAVVYRAVAATTRGLIVYGKIVTSAAGEASTYSVVSSDSGARWVMAAGRMPGMDASYLDAAPATDIFNTSPSTTVADPAVTAVAASTLAVAVNFTNNSSAVYQTFTLSGWAVLVNTTVTSGASTSVLDVEYKELFGAGSTGTSTFTMSPSAATSGGFQFTLKFAVTAGVAAVAVAPAHTAASAGTAADTGQAAGTGPAGSATAAGTVKTLGAAAATGPGHTASALAGGNVALIAVQATGPSAAVQAAGSLSVAGTAAVAPTVPQTTAQGDLAVIGTAATTGPVPTSTSVADHILTGTADAVGPQPVVGITTFAGTPRDITVTAELGEPGHRGSTSTRRRWHATTGS